ncbi:aldo/keto reductase [Aestuariimicrobium ganziense]|uniref:aldo/keto reductase n=1 Tax=Aestuariimicrobium ganziense TaxID=2773677 RepID=UPI001944C658|nr:aldo/keto reductase [Aestuariimicrobium ganziense]
MEHRHAPRLGRDLSVIGQGCWQLGGGWGEVSDDTAREVLAAAADTGITFFDTADVYGDGRSERLVGEFVHARGRDQFVVATKMGRRADPHGPEAFIPANLRRWNDRSRELLGDDTLDLVQLHCPPTPVFSSDEVFDTLDAMVDEGRMRAYGVSVETCDEALTAIAREHVASVQIILNVLRRKPLEQVLGAAADAGVAIIARVPLASGMLSGRFDSSTTFSADDHRQFNRHGESFDQGETFSGVPYEVGLVAARRFGAIAGQGTPAQRALRWIIDQPGVTTVIPGASRPSQARDNAAAAELPPTSAEALAECEAIYDDLVREHVHSRW